MFDLEIPVLLSPGATLPAYAHDGDAGLDLYCNTEHVVLYPGTRARVPTGVTLSIPLGYWGYVTSKSGLALKHGITVLTGTIDSTYRGEISVILINLGQDRHVFRHGDKVAQLVLLPHATVILGVVEQLDNTTRGTNGFGSTGE